MNLVRRGEDYRLREHTAIPVYKSMLYQVLMDYGSAPDFRTLTEDEIVFLYDGLRPNLKRRKDGKAF